MQPPVKTTRSPPGRQPATGGTEPPETAVSTTFQKMHGLGNDFVLLDLRDQDLVVDAELARSLADRRTGIGCDQVLVLRRATGPDHLARFEIWNADGSTAEQCGNGMRCIGLHLQRLGQAPRSGFSLRGIAGDVRVRFLDDGMVEVAMNVPDFRPEAVPVDLLPQQGRYTLDLDGETVMFGAVSMGNPHAVLTVDRLDDALVRRLGPAISTHPAFPQGCNVGFAHVCGDEEIELRVWERGSGETRACGSGACAAMAVLASRGEIGGKIRVQQAGGLLIIAWDGGDAPVMMTGPAVHVFEGTME